MSEPSDGWGLTAGDEIVPGLTAVSLLGGGSAYEAYLAFDEARYCPVVVKLVRPELVDDTSTLRSLRREVDMLGLLNHPAVVRGFAADTGGDRPHVVLENLDGPRLSTLVRRHGPLQPQQALPLGLELCAATHYLHGLGIVHLDIKPSNVIMGAPARLIDLSVARSVESAAELDHPVGTDDYMAPEQCVPGRSHVPGPASDVWGIGATLFHALAGHRPLARGRDDPDACDEDRWPQLVDKPYDLPAAVAPDTAQMVLACLALEPADRPTPREVAESFEPAMDRLPRPRLSGFRPRL
jgi:serine/threonine-protein kinase